MSCIVTPHSNERFNTPRDNLVKWGFEVNDPLASVGVASEWY
jgi:hypothetical protein